MSARKGLGKGLQALGLKQHADDAFASAARTSVEIPVSSIVPNPNQPRQHFDEEALEALADSIRQYGIIQPVVVQKKEIGMYELVAGERRLRAAKICHMQTVPAIIRNDEPQTATAIALIENLQREDLNAIEEGEAYARLISEFGLTQEEAAGKIGKSRSHVANMMRLLHLSAVVQDYVRTGMLTMGQARPLLQLSADKQGEAAEKIIKQNLSARQAEQLVKAMLQTNPGKGKPVPDAYLESVTDRMKMHLGTAVSIRFGKNKKKGKIEISFATEEEFERLLELLTDERKETGTVSSFYV